MRTRTSRVLVDHYDDADWSALWWVRADGTGAILDDGASESEAAIALLRDRYPQQRAVASVLAVTVERWSGWSAASPVASGR